MGKLSTGFPGNDWFWVKLRTGSITVKPSMGPPTVKYPPKNISTSVVVQLAFFGRPYLSNFFAARNAEVGNKTPSEPNPLSWELS